MDMKTTKDRRKNIYINEDREHKMDAIFAHLQVVGIFGPNDKPDNNLVLIIDYALNKAIDSIARQQAQEQAE